MGEWGIWSDNQGDQISKVGNSLSTDLARCFATTGRCKLIKERGQRQDLVEKRVQRNLTKFWTRRASCRQGPLLIVLWGCNWSFSQIEFSSEVPLGENHFQVTSACWKNLLPYGCRTHSGLLLWGQQDSESLTSGWPPVPFLRSLTWLNLAHLG